MTPQEIFDKAYTGVVEQGCRSTKATPYEDIVCVYRSPDGAKCAVGHLIDDATARSFDRQDGSSIANIVRQGHYKVRAWMRKNADLLQDIQFAHDNSQPNSGPEFVAEFKRRMRWVAKDHGLQFPEVDLPRD